MIALEMGKMSSNNAVKILEKIADELRKNIGNVFLSPKDAKHSIID